MNRLIASLSVVSALSMAGCMSAGPQEELGADALAEGEACTHSGACDAGEYCTVEDGDCFSNCPPGEICPAVCWGVCKAEREYCYSDAGCGEREYCSVRDGDCLSPCDPGEICPAVCAGYCLPGDTSIEPVPVPEPIEPRESCYSSANCDRGEYCTTEDGDCFSNCPPGRYCPAVCSGFCAPIEPAPVEPGPVIGQRCGDVTCGAGTVCCNPSCGICTPPGWACTQQVCVNR